MKAKRFTKIIFITILLIIASIFFAYKFSKNQLKIILGEDKANSLLSLDEIKSVCLSASPTIKEGVSDYQEKNNQKPSHWLDWNPTILENLTKFFENAKGASFTLDVTTFDSDKETRNNYDESLASGQGMPKSAVTTKELTIGDKSFITFYSEGYRTETSPKNKANILVFLKGNHRVLLSDMLSNIIPETSLNCTQEELIQLGKLIEKKIQL